MHRIEFVVGIDEAGRGPIAGPVMVGAVAVRLARPEHSHERAKAAANALVAASFVGVGDSKQLSIRTRERLYEALRAADSGDVCFAVARAEARTIDRVGITRAVAMSIARGLRSVGAPKDTSLIVLDGLLRAPAQYELQETITGGDCTEPIIGLASIAAKVTRDRYVTVLASRFPGYGLEQHKGYGTRAHYDALHRLGLSAVHRKTYLKNFAED